MKLKELDLKNFHLVLNTTFNKIKLYPKLSCFFSGFFLTFAFAPYFLIFFLLNLSLLAYYLKKTDSPKQSFLYGVYFGSGHFLSSLYWISIALTIDIKQFGWIIPFSIIGIPFILSLFIAFGTLLNCIIYKYLKKYFFLIFSISWTIMELLRSYIFTGFPWQLLGYSFSFSTTLIQCSSIFGVYGLSFFIVYIFSGFSCIFTKEKKNYLILSIIVLFSIISFGIIRLLLNPTKFNKNILIRLVQPSIIQEKKWSENYFWKNLHYHIELSHSNNKNELVPDFVIWPEDAITIPYTNVLSTILPYSLPKNTSILITGGVIYNTPNHKLYSAMYAIDIAGKMLFEYHKKHLVPFGEYVPLKKIIPIKKLTAGIIDFSSGKTKSNFSLHINDTELKIAPLICYEVIFPEEVRRKSQKSDIIINITNDAWFKNSSGPYQHFYMSILRAVENGIPLIRSANNGISAFIDPLGRTISKTDLYQITTLDCNLPVKNVITLYSIFGNITVLIIMFLLALIYRICNLKY